LFLEILNIINNIFRITWQIFANLRSVTDLGISLLPWKRSEASIKRKK